MRFRRNQNFEVNNKTLSFLEAFINDIAAKVSNLDFWDNVFGGD